MNSERIASSKSPTLEKRAEAAAWLARLRGPERSAEVERGWQRWLRADAQHGRAFELLTTRLEAVERLRTRSLPRRWHVQNNARRSLWQTAVTGLAATLLIALLGAVFYLGDTGLDTRIGEQRMLTLEDGSRVYLNTDTRVAVRFDEGSRTVELKGGEALFEVAKETVRPFVVVAGGQRVQALGTTFVVRHDPQQTAVTLIEGKVAVSSRETSSILSPGQRMIFAANEPARSDRPPLNQVMAWRQGQVALEDMPLSQATLEMNRYSTQKLVVERPEAATVRVAGFFRMGDSASFARAVASTYGLEVIEKPNEIVIAGLPNR